MLQLQAVFFLELRSDFDSRYFSVQTNAAMRRIKIRSFDISELLLVLLILLAVTLETTGRMVSDCLFLFALSIDKSKSFDRQRFIAVRLLTTLCVLRDRHHNK